MRSLVVHVRLSPYAAIDARGRRVERTAAVGVEEATLEQAGEGAAADD